MLMIYSSVDAYPDLGGSAASTCMVYRHQDAVLARVTYGALRIEREVFLIKKLSFVLAVLNN
jgi:hypothetical protein